MQSPNNIVNIDDHKAYSCTCGSTKFCLLKSGKLECAKCQLIVVDAKWGFAPSNDD